VGEGSLEQDGASTSRYNVTADRFEAELAVLERLGYHSVGVSQIAAALGPAKARLPERPIAISFDDGGVDQYQEVFPLLMKYRLVGTFYIPSTYPGGDQTISWDQLAEMAAAGMEIGSHSRTHIDLSKADEEKAWEEIRMSKVELEKRLRVRVDTFAYPFGGFSPELAKLVDRAGYLGGAGLGPSPVQSRASLFYLSRIEVRGDEPLADFVQLLPWRGEGTALCPSSP
jgi:peptidoglycan/xylan/chitin deacetylase (PgdA/CDA1 family)